MAEQFGDEKRLRHGAAVDGDKLSAATCEVMDVPRHQFLADAGFAAEVDRHSQGERLAEVFQACFDAGIRCDEFRRRARSALLAARGAGMRAANPAAGHEHTAAGAVADADDAAVQHLRQRFAEAAVEQRGKVRAALRRQSREQRGAGAIDRKHFPIRRRRKQARREGVEKLAPRMKG